jgi:phage terminase Nu1 subunit (DNA packaging protein)
MPKLSKKDKASKVTITESRRRKEIALMELREMEAARRRGELIDAREAELAWAAAGVKIKNSLLAIPNRVMNRIPAELRPKVFPVLEEEIRAVLTALSSDIRGGNSNVKPAPHSKAVA